MKFKTNDLLSATRIPIRFYAIINNLTGKDASYKNPGVSLSSYIISAGLKDDEMELPTENLIQSKIECEEFSTDRRILVQINEYLLSEGNKLVGKATTIATNDFIAKSFVELSALFLANKDLFELDSKGIFDKAAINMPVSFELRNSLFKTQDKIAYIAWLLETPTPTKSA